MAMRPRTLIPLGVVGMLLSIVPAEAHFKMNQPADWIVTSENGDPQKTSPCGGNGTASNKVTKVVAGSKLHIKVTETIRHGGHYRVAVAANRGDLKDPEPVVQDNNCVSLPIQENPQLPVIADGLFKHDQEDFPNGKVFETDVTIPNTPCPSCTLQVIQFMTPHAPGCFYYHCANIEILPSGSEVPDGGEVEMDAGSSSGGETPKVDGGSSGDDDDDDDDSNGSSPRRLRSQPSSSGCAIGFGQTSGLTLVLGAAVGALVLGRRRRKR